MIDLRSHQKQPKMTLIAVTPDMAQDWLESCNTRNRYLAPTRVQMYAETMKRGLWRHPTGEPIIFDTLGRIQDGQHRLAAQVVAKMTISYWVMQDADPEDFTVIDQGKSRTRGDIVGMHGIPQANQVASIARTYLLMRTYPNRIWSGQSANVLPASVVEFALAHDEELVIAANLGRRVAKATRLPTTAFAAVSFYVRLRVPQSVQWDDFANQVESGAGLADTSPILALRRWAVNRPTHGIPQQEHVAVISKAWNAFVVGKPLTKIFWRLASLPMPLPTDPKF
jgi:hypothetical protein